MTSLPDNIQRRQLLVGSLLTATGLSVAPSSLWARAIEGGPAPSLFLDRLCDLVIPDTQTPGARKCGVPAFVLVAQEHKLKNAQANSLQMFENALNEHVGKPFLTLDSDQQTAVLADIDEQVFSRTPSMKLTPGLQQWQAIKALIVLGYYTSETGSSKELRYNLVPGRFNPDVPADENTRAWSSDWTGVKYG